MNLKFILASFFYISEYLSPYFPLSQLNTALLQINFGSTMHLQHTYINTYKHTNRHKDLIVHIPKIQPWIRYNVKPISYKRDWIQIVFLADETNQRHLSRWLNPFKLVFMEKTLKISICSWPVKIQITYTLSQNLHFKKMVEIRVPVEDQVGILHLKGIGRERQVPSRKTLFP